MAKSEINATGNKCINATGNGCLCAGVSGCGVCQNGNHITGASITISGLTAVEPPGLPAWYDGVSLSEISTFLNTTFSPGFAGSCAYSQNCFDVLGAPIVCPGAQTGGVALAVGMEFISAPPDNLIRVFLNIHDSGSPTAQGLVATLYWELFESDDPTLWDEDDLIDCGQLTSLGIPYERYTTAAHDPNDFISGLAGSVATINSVTTGTP